MVSPMETNFMSTYRFWAASSLSASILVVAAVPEYSIRNSVLWTALLLFGTQWLVYGIYAVIIYPTVYLIQFGIRIRDGIEILSQSCILTSSISQQVTLTLWPFQHSCASSKTFIHHEWTLPQPVRPSRRTRSRSILLQPTRRRRRLQHLPPILPAIHTAFILCSPLWISAGVLHGDSRIVMSRGI